MHWCSYRVSANADALNEAVDLAEAVEAQSGQLLRPER